MQQGQALPAPTREQNKWNSEIEHGIGAMRHGDIESDLKLTRHTIRIFSISSGLRIRGAWPSVRISETGTPARECVRRHGLCHQSRLTVITLGIVWSRYMVRNLTLRRKRIHGSHRPRVCVIWERVESSIWMKLSTGRPTFDGRKACLKEGRVPDHE